MSFEKVALYRKYLLFKNEIPDELKESVIEALKIVDFDQKVKQEEPLLCLIGFIRSCGAIDLMVVQRQAQKYGLDLRSLETNPLFNFWTYYTFDYLIPDDTYGEAILYYDSIPYMDVIANTRLDYELMAPVFMERILECIESCRMTEHLITIFSKLEQFDPKTKELFKKAIYKMPMPYLTGMALQRYPSK